MDAERWARLSALVARALDLPESERTRYLADAAGEEPALRTEILELFQELKESEAFLEEPAVAGAGLLSSSEGLAFGSYRVVRELGEGGMGVVYLAERSDGQFTRQVAIKRVAGVVPGAELLRRFQAEREILARLDHPYIPGLLDAGVDVAGIPYLVMDHVDGTPITAHCRDHGLSVEERLWLFLKVCAAVQHAHAHLIVHRDLKPGNILVTGSGEPKLLDFGIARILAEHLPRDVTRTVNRALTLDYASPEQVRGAPATTAIDVYSLGVLLYELLTDIRPYQTSDKPLTEAVRLVCEHVPAPPSRVAPAERRRELAGDLDGIVAKATEKSAADRYATVTELAADLDAYLHHLPVRARRPSVRYVAAKFVRRHRVATIAAVAALLLAASGVTAVLWQARIADRERARAEARFAEVRDLAKYVIYDLHDGIATLSGSTALRRSMVDHSLRYLDSLSAEAAGDPVLLIEAAGGYQRLGNVLGRPSVSNLGDADGARAAYDKAGALYEQVLSRNAHHGEALRALARLRLVQSEMYPPDRRAGILAEARSIWQRLMQLDARNEENVRGLASTHFALYLQQNQGPGRDPQEMLAALALFQQLLDWNPSDPDRLRNVALCHKYLSGQHLTAPRNLDKALEHAERAAALDARRLELQPDNAQAQLDYSFALSASGSVYRERDEYQPALELFERALDIRRELWEADRADVRALDRMAGMMAYVGNAHARLGRPETATRFLQDAVAHAEPLHARSSSFGTTTSLAEAYVGLARIAGSRRGCDWYRKTVQLLDSSETRLDVLGSALRDFYTEARDALKRCASPGDTPY